MRHPRRARGVPADSEEEPMPGMGSMMMPMLMMLAMTSLLFIPGIRPLLANSADSVIAPLIPFHDKWFVLTVGLVGSSIMVVNTVLRSFFMDPIKQAHLGHRNKQLRVLMREATQSRDPVRLEKIQRMQQRMMPEQMELQSSTMKPMMFTFIFIIAVFSWMAANVEVFRVGYVSLPWNPTWSLTEGKVLFFPAWIATYICLSAPLGRVVDRHIRLFRYRTHPIVLAGETLDEPLLEMLKVEEKKPSRGSTSGRERRRRRKASVPTSSGPRKKTAAVETHTDAVCPECDGDEVERAPDGRLRCDVCRHTWRR